MSGKFIKKCTSVFLSAILLSACVPSAFAVTENSEMTDTNSINQYLPITDDKGTAETPVYTNPVITEPFTDNSGDTEETEASNDKSNIESLSYYEDKDKFIPGDIVFRTIGDITFEELFPEFNITEIAEIIPVIYWISPFVQYDNVYCIRFDDPYCNESNEAISIIESRHDTVLINTFGWWLDVESGAETPVSTEPVNDNSVDVEKLETSNPATDDSNNTGSLSYNEDKDKFIAGDIIFRTIGDITFEELFPEFNITEIAEVIPVIYWISPFVQYDNVYCIRFNDPYCNESNEALSIIESSRDTVLIDFIISVDDESENDNPLTTNPVSTEPVIELKGDADGDGNLTIEDVTCIQKYLAGLISEQEINCSAANVSGNGKVSIDDSTAIQKKLVGIDSDW